MYGFPKGPFFLNQNGPLPRDTARAMEFVAKSLPGAMALRGDHIQRTRVTAGSRALGQEKWKHPAPGRRRGSNRHFQEIAFLAPKKQKNLGAKMRQFIYGFSIIADIGQKHTYTHGGGGGGSRSKDLAFCDASGKSTTPQREGIKIGRKNADPLLGDAIGQVKGEWIRPPLLRAMGRPSHLVRHGWNFAFRLGVNQGDKIRPLDYLWFRSTNRNAKFKLRSN